MEGSLFAILFVFLAVPLLGAQHLAEQGNDHPIGKGQISFQDINVVFLGRLLLGGVVGRRFVFLVWVFLGSDLSFQAFGGPKDGAAELLGAVDGDGVATADQIAAKLLIANQVVNQVQVGLFNLGQ